MPQCLVLLSCHVDVNHVADLDHLWLDVGCVELGCRLDRRWDVVSWRRFEVLVRYFLLGGLDEDVVFAVVGCRFPGVLDVFENQGLVCQS